MTETPEEREKRAVEWNSDSSRYKFCSLLVKASAFLLLSVKRLRIRFPNQAQFHVLKYLDGLIRACISQGVRIFANTHVTKVEGGAPPMVKTEAGFDIHLQAVIVTTNSLLVSNPVQATQAGRIKARLCAFCSNESSRL